MAGRDDGVGGLVEIDQDSITFPDLLSADPIR